MYEEKLNGSMIQYGFRHKFKNKSMLCFYLDVFDTKFETKLFYKLFLNVLNKMYIYVNKIKKENPGKLFELVPTIVYKVTPQSVVYSHILKYLEC